jgi:tRNA dimethylallyltransferase
MKYLVAIVGPTGIGKSSLGLSIAQRFNGEIINSDSRQIYRHMDIGTAKPSVTEFAAVPHHLFDIIAPDQPYSLAHYQASALEAIQHIQERDKLPVLVGGSGQYVWSVVENWQIPEVAPDQEFRERMVKIADEQGGGFLYKQLLGIDPAAAQKMLPGNLRRVIRALEIYEKTGVKPSALQAKKGHGFPIKIVGLTCERERLYDRINLRADGMMKEGLLDEVKRLMEMGYSPGLPSMSSLGYRQISAHLAGNMTLKEAVQAIKWESHRFARNQYAWFRLNDVRISWFDTAGVVKEKIDYTVSSFLQAQAQGKG